MCSDFVSEGLEILCTLTLVCIVQLSEGTLYSCVLTFDLTDGSVVATLGTNPGLDNGISLRDIDRTSCQKFRHSPCRIRSSIEIAIESSLKCENVLMLLRNDLAMRRETFHVCLHRMQTISSGTRFPVMTMGGSLMPLDILYLCTYDSKNSRYSISSFRIRLEDIHAHVPHPSALN